MIEFLFADQVFPFTAAILVMFGIALLEGVGLLFGAGISSIVDSLFPSLDVDVDLPDSGHDGILSKFSGWINYRKVPVLILFVCFLTVLNSTNNCNTLAEISFG